MKEFAKRLKKEREKKKKKDPKWTQEYVADLIGVARPTYTAYENGTKQPPLETVNKLADLFDVSIDYLHGKTDNPRPTGLNNTQVFRETPVYFEENLRKLISFYESITNEEDKRKFVEWAEITTKGLRSKDRSN